MVKNTVRFVRETQQELKKVTWPTREELVGSTVVVVVTTFIMAGFIGAVDFVLSIVIRLLIH